MWLVSQLDKSQEQPPVELGDARDCILWLRHRNTALSIDLVESVLTGLRLCNHGGLLGRSATVADHCIFGEPDDAL